MGRGFARNYADIIETECKIRVIPRESVSKKAFRSSLRQPAIDVQKKIRVKKPGFCQKPGFSTPNDYLTVYSGVM